MSTIPPTTPGPGSNTGYVTPPPPEYGPQNVPVSKRGNGLGVAALVLGIVALVGSVIPLLNYGTGFIAFIGLVLGIIGLILKGRSKGMAIAGAVISFFALILSIMLAIIYTAGFASAVKRAGNELSTAARQPVDVVYEVAGASTDATVTYSTWNDGKSGMEQATAQTLPFTKTVTIEKGNLFSFNSFTLTATNGQSGSDISCKITVGEKVLAEQTSTGQNATVMCNATGFNK